VKGEQTSKAAYFGEYLWSGGGFHHGSNHVDQAVPRINVNTRFLVGNTFVFHVVSSLVQSGDN
jgi:hypothetical protein